MHNPASAIIRTLYPGCHLGEYLEVVLHPAVAVPLDVLRTLRVTREVDDFLDRLQEECLAVGETRDVHDVADLRDTVDTLADRVVTVGGVVVAELAFLLSPDPKPVATVPCLEVLLFEFRDSRVDVRLDVLRRTPRGRAVLHAVLIGEDTGEVQKVAMRVLHLHIETLKDEVLERLGDLASRGPSHHRVEARPHVARGFEFALGNAVILVRERERDALLREGVDVLLGGRPRVHAVFRLGQVVTDAPRRNGVCEGDIRGQTSALESLHEIELVGEDREDRLVEFLPLVISKRGIVRSKLASLLRGVRSHLLPRERGAAELVAQSVLCRTATAVRSCAHR